MIYFFGFMVLNRMDIENIYGVYLSFFFFPFLFIDELLCWGDGVGLNRD